MLSRCHTARSLEEAIDGCHQVLIIEAVTEVCAAKRKVYQAMAEACTRRGIGAERVLFCSNTFPLNLENIATHLPPPFASRVVGMRFLGPCWFVDHVEVTLRSAQTPWAEAASLAAGEAAALLQALGFVITVGRVRLRRDALDR